MLKKREPVTNEKQQLLTLQEGHFLDFKDYRISPKKIQQTFVAFANADGGEIYVGIGDPSKVPDDKRIHGFAKMEDTNDLLHVLLEETAPAVENVDIEFIDFDQDGLVLHITIPKSPKVHYASDKECYVRINARNSKIRGERILQLGYAKGIYQYEKQPVPHLQVDDVLESLHLDNYMQRIGSRLEKTSFLKKQRLLSRKDGVEYPNVGCVLLFDDEPQASLDTRCAIKLYRLRTTSSDYKRDQLETPPETINGPIEEQIHIAIKKITGMLSAATYREGDKLVRLSYPDEAVKEILVNAVIHRDYSLNDDIHVRIYDNRIEVQSPGRLPGYINVQNIYDERFSRNPNLVRMLHKLPDPVNLDIGEGLNTARNALRKAGLVPPVIEELENAVRVTIKHQRLASLEDIILKYFKENPNGYITNRKVRELSGEEDVNKVKGAFQRLRRQGKIVPEDPNARPFDFRYRLPSQDENA